MFNNRVSLSLFKSDLISCTADKKKKLFLTCLLGWVDFALFWNFIKSQGLAVPYRYNMGNYQIFLILVQKPVRATLLKVNFFEKCVLKCLYYIRR